MMLFLGGCFSTKPHYALDKTAAGELGASYQGPQAKIAVNDLVGTSWLWEDYTCANYGKGL